MKHLQLPSLIVLVWIGLVWRDQTNLRVVFAPPFRKRKAVIMHEHSSHFSHGGIDFLNIILAFAVYSKLRQN
jgi:hypothetical protein